MALIAIIPRHLRILGKLIEQRRADMYGCIGWRGLLDDPETFTMDQLFKPLQDRGLIEDMTLTMGNGGTYFVRITPLGQFCYGIGYMLKDARPTTEAEIRKYITTPEPMKMIPPDGPEAVKYITSDGKEGIRYRTAPKVPQGAFNAINTAVEAAERKSGVDPNDLQGKA